jgi:hypothetical protein
MRKTLLTAALLTLVFFVPGSVDARERTLADLRVELEALTEAVTTQMKLLEVFERVERPDEAMATRKRIRDLLESQKRVVVELEALLGGGAAAPVRPPMPRIGGIGTVPSKPVRPARLPGIGGGVAMPPVEPVPMARPQIMDSEHVTLALDWLSRHQSELGNWDSDGFANCCPEEPCDGPGYALYDPGVTGLATLAFLGAGETHKHGRYKNTVREGLKYLKQIQDSEGCFGLRTTNHYTYNHAIAAWAMAEAYALTASPLFKKSAQQAVDFIQKAQNPYLAWRYGVRPGDNDTSVTGWMVAALAAGREAGLRVSPDAFTGALAWVEKMTEPEFGRVGYTTMGTGPARAVEMMSKFPPDKSESLTAEGISIRMAAGELPGKSETILKGADLILRQRPTWNTSDGSVEMYFWFWGTHALDQVGGEAWSRWAQDMSSVVEKAQRMDGNAKGSFDPVGPWGREGGRVYSTALMTLTAEILENRP